MQKTIKYIVIIICFTAYCLPVHGQAMWALLFGKKIHNDKLSLGIHVGLEASDLTNTPGSNLLAGIALGAYTNVKLGDKWALSNYFIFKSSRGAASLPLIYQLQPNVPGADSANIRRKLTYIEISPLMRYSLTPELSIAVGPQFAVRAATKDKYTLTLPNDGRETIIYNTKGFYNWLDVDAAADVQYAFYKGKGIRLNLRFSQGLTNVYKDETLMHAKNQYFQLGVGFPIPIGTTEK